MSDPRQWKVAYVIMEPNGSRVRIATWFDSERAALAAVLNASRSRFIDSSTVEYVEPRSDEVVAEEATWD